MLSLCVRIEFYMVLSGYIIILIMINIIIFRNQKLQLFPSANLFLDER